MLRAAALFAVVLVAVLFLFAQYVRRMGMFYPERFPLGVWDTRTLPIEPADETFTTSDGVRLHAWLFHASAAGAPLLIWMHGNGGNITSRAPIAANFASRGISVLLFDWRGYGKSEGRPSERALFDDALAAYEHAVHLGIPPGRIVLYGESLGGPYVAWLAARKPVRAVIIENSFGSLRELGNGIYRPLPLGWFAPFSLTTTRWLNQAGAPVLVMHGRNDAVIPFALGEAMYEALRVPKEMFVSERARHCEIESVEGERYYEAVTRFVYRATSS